MGLFDALTSAVSGLQGQSFAMQNIIRQHRELADHRLQRHQHQFLRPDPGRFDSSQQVAGGVISTSIATNNVQGAIQNAASGTDMAINGDGFLLVQSPTSFSDNAPVFGSVDLCTRRGDFQLDANGYLVNGAGYYLEGLPIDPTTGNPTGTVAAPLQFQNNFLPASATTQVQYGINLPTIPKTNAFTSTIPNSELLNATDFTVDPIVAGTGKVEGQDVTTFINESIDGGSVTVYSTTGTQANLQLRWVKVKSVASGRLRRLGAVISDQFRTDERHQHRVEKCRHRFTFNSTGQLSAAVTSVPLNGITVDGVALGNVTVSTLTGTGAALGNESAKTFTVDDGSGNGAIAGDITGFTGAETMQNVVDQINTDLVAAGSSIAASIAGGQIQLTNGTGKTITVAGTAAVDLGFGAGNTTSSNGVPGIITLGPRPARLRSSPVQAVPPP